MIFTILIFIVTLLILVVIHELGHFLVAKKFNIKVEEFGFGIPPRAWGKKVGETLVSINWLPFGGFVRLLGEDLPAGRLANGKFIEDPRSFAAQTVGKRMAVVVAGVLMNLFLAWLLFYIVLGFQGFKLQLPLIVEHQFLGVTQKNETAVIVQGVMPGSPAEVAGLHSGEKIKKINGLEIKTNAELIEKTKKAAGEEIQLTISNLKNNNQREVTLIPRENPPKGEGPLGVSLAQFQIANLQYETPMQKVLAGPVHSINIIAYSGKIIGLLVGESFKTGKLEPVSQTVAGPVGITNVVNSILTESKDPLLPYLDFVAALSLNLAVFNVLPIPALDGGRLFFLMYEAVTRRKVKAEVEKWIHTIGMVLLLSLMLLITFSDIKKLLP